MTASALAALVLGVLAVWAAEPPAPPRQTPGESRTGLVARGRYVVMIAGCNDCHTAGFTASGGTTPEGEWLTGDSVGWRGPWGTTYPTNLRISIGKKSEEQWVKYAKTLSTKPPMPWFNVRAMTDTDLRALYQYVKSLGVAGKAAPAFVPPGKEPKMPYVLWPGVVK